MPHVESALCVKAHQHDSGGLRVSCIATLVEVYYCQVFFFSSSRSKHTSYLASSRLHCSVSIPKHSMPKTVRGAETAQKQLEVECNVEVGQSWWPESAARASATAALIKYLNGQRIASSLGVQRGCGGVIDLPQRCVAFFTAMPHGSFRENK